MTDGSLPRSLTRATNIVLPPIQLVGRRRERQQLTEVVLGGGRLISLLGMAGIGKTSLALTGAVDLLDRLSFAGGAWFCDLHNASTERDLCQHVARVLGISIEDMSDLSVMQDYLVSQLLERCPCLLVLDNFEQLVAVATAAVVRWLDSAPTLVIIITSRIRLKVDLEIPMELSTLSEEDASGLFTTKARGLPSGTLAPQLQDEIRLLVRHLDGVPLAIELAAAWTHVLSPSQLLARLNERLDLLRTDSSAPDRHHTTLRAALDASWTLLSAWEQEALVQCAVFEGSFPLEAAEAILDLSRFRMAPPLIAVIGSLVDQSLLHVYCGETSDGCVRFRFLETIRQFAVEKWDVFPYRSQIEGRHARYFVEKTAEWSSFIETISSAPSRIQHEAASRIPGATPRSTEGALACLHLVREDLEAVVRRTPEQFPELCSQAARCLSILYWHHGRHDHVGRLLPIMVKAARLSQMPDVLARALVLEAWSLLEVSGQSDRGFNLLEEAMETARRADLLQLHGRLFGSLSFWSLRLGRLEAAIRYGEQGLLLLHQLADQVGISHQLNVLGIVYRQSRKFDRARECFEQAKALHWESFSSPSVTLDVNLGLVFLDQWRLSEARRRMEAAEQAPSTTSSFFVRTAILVNFANLELAEGRLELARSHYGLSLERFRLTRRRHPQVVSLLGLGIVAMRQNGYSDALKWFEEALSKCVPSQAYTTVIVLAFFAICLLAMHEAEEARRRLTEAFEGLARADSLERAPLQLLLLEVQRLLVGRFGGPGIGGAINSSGMAELPPSFYERIAREVLSDLQNRTLAPDVAARQLNSDRASIDTPALTPATDVPQSDTIETERSEDPGYSKLEPRVLSSSGSASLATPGASSAAVGLIVDRWGRWIEFDGKRVSLVRRRAIGELLKALVRHRIDHPGVPLDVYSLVECGWPGEKVDPVAGANRVYAGLKTLRSLGLHDVLQNRYGGYCLDPDTPVDWFDKSPNSA